MSRSHSLLGQRAQGTIARFGWVISGRCEGGDSYGLLRFALILLSAGERTPAVGTWVL